MSELVDFQDMGELDGADLRAVFDQVSREQLLAALSGAPSGLRAQLLARLPSTLAADLESRIGASPSISIDEVRTAQRALVEALCRLSRSGQVAFDDPEDMVA